jgi:hypothetical protein
MGNLINFCSYFKLNFEKPGEKTAPRPRNSACKSKAFSLNSFARNDLAGRPRRSLKPHPYPGGSIKAEGFGDGEYQTSFDRVPAGPIFCSFTI